MNVITEGDPPTTPPPSSSLTRGEGVDPAISSLTLRQGSAKKSSPLPHCHSLLSKPAAGASGPNHLFGRHPPFDLLSPPSQPFLSSPIPGSCHLRIAVGPDPLKTSQPLPPPDTSQRGIYEDKTEGNFGRTQPLNNFWVDNDDRAGFPDSSSPPPDNFPGMSTSRG